MGRQQQPPQRWRLVIACLVLAAAVMVLHVQGWRVPSLHHQQPARSVRFMHDTRSSHTRKRPPY